MKAYAYCFQSTQCQTDPPLNYDTFVRCYGRKPKMNEVGLLAKVRYERSKGDIYAVNHGELESTMITAVKMKRPHGAPPPIGYADSSFQTMDFPESDAALQKAKVQAEDVAKKLSSPVKEAGCKINIQKDAYIAHSHGVQSAVIVTEEGEIIYNGEENPRILPNIIIETIEEMPVVPALSPQPPTHSDTIEPPPVPAKETAPTPIHSIDMVPTTEPAVVPQDSSPKELILPTSTLIVDSSKVRYGPGNPRFGPKKAETAPEPVTAASTEQRKPPPEVQQGAKPAVKRKAEDEPGDEDGRPQKKVDRQRKAPRPRVQLYVPPAQAVPTEQRKPPPEVQNGAKTAPKRKAEDEPEGEEGREPKKVDRKRKTPRPRMQPYVPPAQRARNGAQNDKQTGTIPLVLNSSSHGLYFFEVELHDVVGRVPSACILASTARAFSSCNFKMYQGEDSGTNQAQVIRRMEGMQQDQCKGMVLVP
ncbi:hypothetical protein CC80DRAFT_551672 [Byssothecium circinans]|uniref:Uncharacterized protein n=1 Tax=Byssothecium circinans TaxID=147558 RepID=A0A6A5TKQ1_9PLEO|nr:hypothetical protein CC80DRAFT_551672 [Byssothecium circinans]